MRLVVDFFFFFPFAKNVNTWGSLRLFLIRRCCESPIGGTHLDQEPTKGPLKIPWEPGPCAQNWIERIASCTAYKCYLYTKRSFILKFDFSFKILWPFGRQRRFQTGIGFKLAQYNSYGIIRRSKAQSRYLVTRKIHIQAESPWCTRYTSNFNVVDDRGRNEAYCSCYFKH